MKLKSLLLLIFALPLTGCWFGETYWDVSTTYYIYENATEDPITMEVYYAEVAGETSVLDTSVVILPGTEVQFEYRTRGIASPFSGIGNGHVVVSNGEKTFTQKNNNSVWVPDYLTSLFSNSSYADVSTKKRIIRKYVFTDDDFKWMEIASYFYRNDTSFDKLWVEVFHTRESDGAIVSDFNFHVFNSMSDHLILSNNNGYVPLPFQEEGVIYETSYVTVSNGEKQFTQYYKDFKGTLFDISIYESLEKDNLKPYYSNFEYVFTDEDFKNAEPIN